MDFAEHTHSGLTVEAYQSGSLTIGGQTFRQPVLLSDQGILPAPAPAEAAGLDGETLTALLDGRQAPEVILIGTGDKQQFLHPKTVAALAARGIGLESMNTAAACRTLLVLQSEGRRVWAWLWP